MRKRTLILGAASLIAAIVIAGMAQNGPEKAPPLPAGMTGSNANDPRSNLKPGLFDAGETASGIRHLALLKKPDSFQLGVDPTGPMMDKAMRALGIPSAEMVPLAQRMAFGGLAFANSDIAFQGNRLFLGNFYGINIYDISEPAKTKLLTSMVCPGGQGDVSVFGNLMFMSVEMPNGRLDCGDQGFPPTIPMPGQPPLPAANKDRFRGVRIFDISDISRPKQVGAVQTCRGSHTHTLVKAPQDKENVYIYVSGTSFVRPNEELAGCSDGTPDANPDTARFRIDIIKVPIAAPQNSRVIASPRIFSDPATGKIDALTDAGSHDNKGRVEPTDQCHDITVFEEIGLAAGACAGNGILLDISNPAEPKRIDSVNDKNYAYWHSASFSNDGKKVLYTDEWGGGLGARCRENDPNVWGADAIFELGADRKLKFASYYKMPAAQTESENCVAHNGSIVPVPGRDLKVQAWYQGGISIVDFTDAAKPVEVAYFDRGPLDPKMLILGGSWSAYWYNGNIYSSEIARGLDIFELVPTKFISQNEIDAAKTVRLSELNVQSQEQNRWPNKLVVAKAYLDQLERSRGLATAEIAKYRKAILAAERSRKSGPLKALSAAASQKAASAADTNDAARLAGIAAVLGDPAF